MTSKNNMIDDFVAFFRSNIGLVEQISVPQKEALPLYQKILYVGLFDSLSKALELGSGNRERYTKALMDFSSWPDAKRVSSTHLAKALSHVSDPLFDELKKYLQSKLENWHSGEFIPLSYDPTFEEIISLWPKNQSPQIPGINLKIERFQHAHLFYNNRSTLVHEFQQAGYSPDFGDSEIPYYIHFGLEETKPRHERWLLVFPRRFYPRLCLSLLESVRHYLISQGKNPFDAYSDSQYIIDGLDPKAVAS